MQGLSSLFQLNSRSLRWNWFIDFLGSLESNVIHYLSLIVIKARTHCFNGRKKSFDLSYGLWTADGPFGYIFYATWKLDQRRNPFIFSEKAWLILNTVSSLGSLGPITTTSVFCCLTWIRTTFRNVHGSKLQSWWASVKQLNNRIGHVFKHWKDHCSHTLNPSDLLWPRE